jgi:hypothetical protein
MKGSKLRAGGGDAFVADLAGLVAVAAVFASGGLAPERPRARGGRDGRRVRGYICCESVVVDGHSDQR